MPDISQVNTISDGAPLDSQELNSNIFQAGREVGFDGTSKGGGEVFHGQITSPNFASGTSTLIGPELVRRGALTLGPFSSGSTVNRDIGGHELFMDFDPDTFPEVYDVMIPIIGKTWENRRPVRAVEISWHVCYVNGPAPGETDTPDYFDFDQSGLMTLFLNGVPINQCCLRISNGRSSTINSDNAASPYNNNPNYPDFRVWTDSIIVDAALATQYTLGSAAMTGAGWHSASIRVMNLRRILRIKTAHMTVIPI